MLKKIRIISEIIVAVTLGFSLIFGITLWRIYQAPISIGLLTRALENVISSDNDEILIAIDDTVVAWGGWDRLIEIRALGVKALGGDRLLTEIPVMSVGLSGLALMRGVIAPNRIELVKPHLLIIRSENGIGFDLGGSGAESGTETGSGEAPILKQMTQSVFGQPKAGNNLSYLKRISITGAQLTFEDQILNQHWSSEDSSLVFDRYNKHIEGHAVLNVITGDRSALIEAGGRYQIKSQFLDVQTKVTGLRPNKIAEKIPDFENLAYLNIPFNFDMHLGYDLAQDQLDAVMTVGAYTGLVESQNSEIRLAIDDLNAQFLLPPKISLMNLDMAQLQSSLQESGIDFQFSGYLEGNGQKTPLSLSLDRQIPSKEAIFAFDFSNFMPASYAVLLPQIKKIILNQTAEKSVNSSLEQISDQENRLPDLGYVHDNEQDVFQDIESLFVVGQFPVSGHIVGNIMTDIATGETHLEIPQFALPQIEGYQLKDISFKIEGKEGVVQLPDTVNSAPIAVYDIVLQGTAFDNKGFLTLSQFDIDLGGAQIISSGYIQPQDQMDNLQGYIEANIASIPVSLIQSSWPAALASGAQEWVVENLRSGKVTDFKVTSDFSLRNPFENKEEFKDKDKEFFELGELAGTFNIIDARTGYFGELADIEEASAQVKFNAKQFDFDISHAKIQDLTLRNGRISFKGLDQEAPHQVTDISVDVTGELGTIMDVLNSKPLQYADAMGLVPQDIKADVTGTFKASFPLLNDLKLSQLKLNVDGKLEKLSYESDALKHAIQQGNFDIALTTEKMTLEGLADLNAIPIQVKIVENFNKKSNTKTKAKISLQTDEDGLEKLKIPLMGHYISGPANYDLDVESYFDQSVKMKIAADMMQANLSFPELKWQKKVGDPGKVEAVLFFRKNQKSKTKDLILSQVQDLHFVFPDLSGKGSLKFTNNGELLESVDLRDVIFDRSRLSHVSYANNDSARAISLKGDFLDLKRFYNAEKQLEKSSTSSQKPKAKPQKETLETSDGILADFEIEPSLPYSIVTSIDLGTLSFGGKENIHNILAKIVHDGTFWRKINISAISKPKNKIRLEYVRGRAPNELVVWVDNVEKFAKAIGVLQNIRAGSLAVTGNNLPKEQGGSFAGRLEMRDYRLVNAPTLAKLLTVASLTGILDILATGDGLTFSKMSGQYFYKQKSLALQNLRTYSPALGITASGSVDLASNQINLTGTVAPAYLFSQVIESIPVVGRILTGSKGEGVFAATYAMDGNLEDPNISLNPLAALAPGFLRDIFGLVDHKKTLEADPRRPE